jgi:hypothetical protein
MTLGQANFILAALAVPAEQAENCGSAPAN